MTLSVDNAQIERALRFSRFAQRLLQSDPALAEELGGPLADPWTSERMRSWLAGQPVENEDQLKQALRRLRKRVMLRLIVRDLTGLADLSEVVATATGLAETAINFAQPRLARWLAGQYGEPIGDDTGTPQELIVIGMGKLGGGELNVSSDIDLIFAYPEDGETGGPKVISNHEFFTLLGRRLIAAIGDMTADGYVFRVDMRLRPYGDSGPLVSSFAMLENYFETQGREWERYAWIKGRALTGERGDELISALRPFVYRKYLDFGALASMRELHAQIRQEVRRRELSDNIKLGPGGIREIEFSAQVFQLIRGGREVALQIRPTVPVLRLIENKQLLNTETVHELIDAYVFLRNLEHRLQYLDDQQTQELPTSPEDRELIAQALGYADWDTFLPVLERHRQKVTRHFEQIFSAPQSDGQAHPLQPLWTGLLADEEAAQRLAGLGYGDPAASWDKLKRLREGNRYRQMPDSSRKRFDALLPALIEVAAGHANPDDTLERILTLMENISRRESYLALLLEYPQTLSQVARLCSASPWVSAYLTAHPILLDELLDTRRLYAEPDWGELKAELDAELAQYDGDQERVMDLLRHFKQAQVFRLVAQDLAGVLTLERLSDHLSALADLMLDATIRLCWAALRQRHRDVPRFAVIGYGKLGGKELGYASDLDIIFLFDDDALEAPEAYAKLGQRINTWITSYTPAGILYETDLRLRPNGSSGLLVSSVEAFDRYQHENAWVWEHQALTRARYCAGDAHVGEAFERIRCDVLRKERNLETLRQEIIAMRQKMRDAHRNTGDLFDVKHDPGGIVDVEFIVQYLVLGYAHRHPELTGNVGNIALLKLAGELGLTTPDRAEAARVAYREFRRLQHAERLQGQGSAKVAQEVARPYAEAVRSLWGEVFAGSH